jgi:predicted RNase H-related nuclease YkuK (DUF458 family)
MLEEVKQAIANSSNTSSVYIGCDSIRFKKQGRFYARYATVVILHKDSRHGCQLFYTEETLPDFGKKTEGLRQRLINEAGFAIGVASELIDVIGDRHMEIHLDINPKEEHASSKAVKEATGYVLGATGIIPKIKPFAFAAMHAADRVARIRGLGTRMTTH